MLKKILLLNFFTVNTLTVSPLFTERSFSTRNSISFDFNDELIKFVKLFDLVKDLPHILKAGALTASGLFIFGKVIEVKKHYLGMSIFISFCPILLGDIIACFQKDKNIKNLIKIIFDVLGVIFGGAFLVRFSFCNSQRNLILGY